MLTEGGVRVPMVAWMPGTIPQGTVNDTMVQMIDFYQTFADFAGATLPDPVKQPLDGESLKEVLTGNASTTERDAIFWHFPGYLDTRAKPTSVINKDYNGERFKLYFFYETRHWELYNLTVTIGETNDLLDTPEEFAANEFIAALMSKELRCWFKNKVPRGPTY